VHRRQQLLPLRLLLLLMATATVFLLVSNRVEAGVPGPAPMPHLVIAGENLWEIASEINLDRDIRAVIQEIEKLNRLSSTTLQPGQVIMLPAQ